ncbi:invasion associated locus B family protein [Acuticoccus sp.]|uniref:invasion associated locus B family protein n=1 Tax=Acuticoccus sp. TaxID=1904378 RepID=UPI003B52E2D3
MRASPRRLALAAVLAIAVASSDGSVALGAEPVWFVRDDAAGPGARWGIPQTDAVGLEVTCRGGRVIVRPALFAMEEPAQPPDVRFTVDGEDFVRDASLAFVERDAAWQAAAEVEPDDPLVDAMRRGSQLTYDFAPPLREGDAFTISLSGSAKAIDAVLSSC